MGKETAVEEASTTIIAYHGTDSKFSKFSSTYIGARDPGFLGRGFYFSTDTNVGKRNRYLMQVKLSLRKSLTLELPEWRANKQHIVRKALGLEPDTSAEDVTKALRKAGYDSVVLDYSPVQYHHKEIMVLDADDVKFVGYYRQPETAAPKPTPVHEADGRKYYNLGELLNKKQLRALVTNRDYDIYIASAANNDYANVLIHEDTDWNKDFSTLKVYWVANTTQKYVMKFTMSPMGKLYNYTIYQNKGDVLNIVKNVDNA